MIENDNKLEIEEEKEETKKRNLKGWIIFFVIIGIIIIASLIVCLTLKVDIPSNNGGGTCSIGGCD